MHTDIPRFDSLGHCVKPHEQILLAVDVLKANFFFEISGI